MYRYHASAKINIVPLNCRSEHGPRRPTMTTTITLDGDAGLASVCAAGTWLVAGNRVSSPTRVA